MNAAAFIVFAKVPQPGQVKTRLCPPFSPKQAAEFQAAMLADVLATTAAITRELDLAGVLAIHPWEQRGAILRAVPASFRVVAQRGASLAARMTWAVREAAAGGAQRILLRGSDTPTLAAGVVRSALSALRDADLVLQPDFDGGYGLVGLRRPLAGLFAHAMSTPSVLADTLANAAGLRTFLAEPGFDIDAAADLARLAAARRSGHAAACPRTLAYLDAAGLWPERMGPGKRA